MRLSVLIMAAMVAVTLLLAAMASRGKDLNLEQWAVGGRGLGSVLVFLLLAGEIYTVFTFLGGSGFAYAHGGAVYYIFAYCTITYTTSYFLLPPIWRYAKQHGLLSQADFLAHRYASPWLGNLVALVGVVALIPYVVLQLKGLGIVVSAASYGAIDPHLAVWIGCAVMTFYVLIAGLKGSTWAATLKDAVVLVVVVFLGVYIPYHYFGDIGSMFQAIESDRPGFLALPERGMSSVWYVSTVIVTSLGFFMWPQFFPAMFSSRDEKVFRRNAILLPLYSLVLLFAFFVGFAAVLKVPGLEGPDADLALFKISTATFPVWMVGLIGGAGALTALVPGSIIIMTAATLVANNLVRIIAPRIDDPTVLRIAKTLVPVIAIVGGLITISGAETMVTIQLIGFSLVTQFIWAFLAGIAPGRPMLTRQGAGAGIFVGISVTGLLSASGLGLRDLFTNLPEWTTEINSGLIALCLNLAVAVAVSLCVRWRGTAVLPGSSFSRQTSSPHP